MNNLILIFFPVAGFLLPACDNSTKDQNTENSTPQNSVAEIREMGGESITGPFAGNDVILFLSNLRITDAELVHVKEQTQLKTLFLDGTAITDAGLVHLEGLNALKTLNLEQTKVTDGGVSKLKQALPDCHVVYESAEGRLRDRLRSEIEKRGGSASFGEAFKVSVRGPNADAVLKGDVPEIVKTRRWLARSLLLVVSD